MTSLADLQLIIAREIAADPAIEALCQSIWGKSLSVFIGVDEKNLPEADAFCPWAGIAVSGYERPTTSEKTSNFTLESAVYIQDDTVSQDTVAPQITIIKGYSTIEQLSDLVFSAIERAVSTSPTQLQMTYVSESGTRFGLTDSPEFVALRTWTIGIS